jgi:NADPH2:quinone reductase
MGILLVQLLKARGARVAGAARGQAKLGAVAGAGADAVVDYDGEGWPAMLLDATEGVRPAVVLDGVGGQLGQDAYRIIAEGGRFSAHGAPSGTFTSVDPEDARRRGIAVTGLGNLQAGPGERAALAAQILTGLAAGQLSPLIGQTFALAEAARAHAAIEARATLAKTLLTVA